MENGKKWIDKCLKNRYNKDNEREITVTEILVAVVFLRPVVKQERFRRR